MKINIKCIGDIHFGSIDPKILYNELKENFIKNILKDEDNLIIILGDYFDRKLQLNDISSVIGIKFMHRLVKLCNSYKIKVRLIKGTKTHDYNQLENFRFLEKEYPKIFRIINKIEIEEMKFGTDLNTKLKILYVPEEYVNDQNQYYKEFKENKFDLMFGHGTWDVFAFKNQIQESEKPIKGYPVFNYKEWEDTIKYNMIFGHIHVRNSHKKLHYTGSYSRWIFGEKEPKGFIQLTIDTDIEKSYIKFIENNLATKYIIINIPDIPNDYLDRICSKILKIVNDNPDKYYRLDINEVESFKNLSVIKEIFSNNPKVSIHLNSKIISKHANKDNIIITDESEKNENGKINDFKYNNSDVSKNIQTFIKDKNNKIISIEKINELSLETKD